MKKMESIIINQVIVGCRFEHALEAPEPHFVFKKKRKTVDKAEDIQEKMSV